MLIDLLSIPLEVLIVNKEFKKQKEKLVKELATLIDDKGLSHEDTVKKSQELDKFILVETMLINFGGRRND